MASNGRSRVEGRGIATTVIPEAARRLSGTQIESRPTLGPGSEFILGRALRATRGLRFGRDDSVR